MQNKQKSQNTVVRRFYSVSVSHLLMQIIQMGILFNAESDPGALGFGLRFCITNECLREADIAGPQTTRWATRRAIMPPKQLFLFVYQFSSVQFSHSVVSDSLRPHESQHTRPPCPSPTPGVHSDSRPSSPWCHPAISSSVVPFSSCLQHQGLFQWVNSSHEVAKVLEFQLQHHFFQRNPRADLLQNGSLSIELSKSYQSSQLTGKCVLSLPHSYNLFF